MVAVASVLFIFFGLISVLYLLSFIIGGEFGYSKMAVWILSIFITAISAGVIWGNIFT